MPTLHQLQTGQSAIIGEIIDVDIAIQALRIGIHTGEIVTCIAKIPAGPTVIRRGGMELAIGKGLCEQIEVQIQ